MTFESADLNWVETDDSHSMAQKIIDVLQNPEKCIQKQKVIRKALEGITWQNVVAEYMILFEKQIRHMC